MFKTLSSLLSTFFFFSVIFLVVLITSLWQISQELPDYQQLENYSPAVTTRLYAGDGQLMMEYAAKKRFFVPEDKIPSLVKNAFIAAEDKNFYNHFGVDVFGVIRAIIGNVKNIGSGRRPSGASTITQQVAKNFLLSSELSYKRKIKEAILATRIEQAFSKQHILELYLNEIYLGNRSYGVAAAALNYFNKSLDELSIEEVAYLAALPKGPNNYNPKTKYEAAIGRRNWVIDRMAEEEYINEADAEIAKSKPLKINERQRILVQDSHYFSEEVRRYVNKNFGEDALYEEGLLVRTTLDPTLQKIATKVFDDELKEYDSRHGWRGAIANIDTTGDYKKMLEDVQSPQGKDDNWKKAVVLKVSQTIAEIEVIDGEKGEILLNDSKWARKNLKNQAVGYAPKSVAEILKPGDVVLVEKNTKNKSYALRQVPDVEGAMIAIDPHTGKVLAMVGGYSFEKSQFNRATQALRQTGSVFKPIVYLAALENGYSPTDLILDAPFVLDQGFGQPLWKPVNYSKKFYGLIPLRQGIEKSRNLMTVRLAQDVGMDKVAQYTKKLGVNQELPELLSMSLGAGETKLINMAQAFSIFVNGGKKVDSYLIERIQDRHGKTIYKHDNRVCQDCFVSQWNNQELPKLMDTREQIVDPLSAYQMVSILEGVVQYGTGARLKQLNRHIAGKTGTTNKNQEAWFVGFSPDLVVAVYVGFDTPRSLGRFETGASAALPIFSNFMKEALANQPDIPFRIPAGIKLVRINHDTGRPARPEDKSVIIEALKPEFDIDSNKQRIIGENNKLDDAQDNITTNNQFQNNNQDAVQLGSEY